MLRRTFLKLLSLLPLAGLARPAAAEPDDPWEGEPIFRNDAPLIQAGDPVYASFDSSGRLILTTNRNGSPIGYIRSAEIGAKAGEPLRFTYDIML